jgi:tape measure domain-containing protein
MAKLGDLVVRIGADTRDLNKSLGKVQRNMRSMTSNFTALGQQMTRSITVPILGIGAMAIKSAADLEKMEVSFISLTGGAKQAADMMKQLNEFTANTPFQIDAVATSARQLIASGTKISEVNEQLQFLGDIAATTGQPINEIAAIFSKVNAKGKVELESLNQLAERGIPIFKALSDATGLLPSELGAGRVSVEQFNATLKSFNEEGGLAEGAMDKLSKTATGKFSTALDNLKIAGAALVKDLLPALNAVLDKTIDLAKGFTRLSDEAKKNILSIGGLAATIGPLLIIVPRLIAAIDAARDATVKFSAALLTNPFVLAGVALTALSVIIVQASMDMKTARTETDDFITSLKELDKQASINAINKQIIADREKLAQANVKLAESQRAANAAGDKFDRQNGRSNTSLYENQINDLTIGLFRLEEQLFAVKNTAILDEPGEDAGLVKVISRTQMEALDSLPAKLIAVQEPIKELHASTIDLGLEIKNTTAQTLTLAQAFGTAFGNMLGGAKSAGSAFTTFAVEAIRAIISIAKANIIASAMSPLNPVNGVTAGLSGPAFALAGLTALDAILANVPSLADGGIAFGRSLVEVGEYSGASGNPEVIAPLSKLKDMIGGNSIQVYGRISGDDIVISNDRATRDRNRF